MNRYYDDIRNKETKLTKEQEWNLIALAQSGCTESRDIVFNANARFVIHEAKKRRMIEYLPDLVQAGNIGLLKAINTFDVKSGNKFITYATWCVRSEMNIYLDKNYRTIRVSAFALREISKGTMDKEEITSSVSLTNLDQDNTGFITHSDNQPELLLIDKNKQIDLILSKLTVNEQKVIKMRIGYSDGETMPFKQIAKKMKMTVSNCSMLYFSGIKKLQKKYKPHQLLNLF